MNCENIILRRLLESTTNIDYMKATDEELVTAIKTKRDRRAEDTLLKRYEGLIRHVTKNFFIKGGDKDDLAQIGLLAVMEAVKDFVPERNKNFKQFAMLAVKRRVQDEIRKANTYKRSPLNDYDPYEDNDDSPMISKQTPEDIVFDRDSQRRIQDYMKKNLTTHEFNVLKLYLQGLKYPEIAAKLNVSRKSVDNAMQHIRSKMRVYKEKFRDSKIIPIIESILCEDRDILKESLAYRYFFGVRC